VNVRPWEKVRRVISAESRSPARSCSVFPHSQPVHPSCSDPPPAFHPRKPHVPHRKPPARTVSRHRVGRRDPQVRGQLETTRTPTTQLRGCQSERLRRAPGVQTPARCRLGRQPGQASALHESRDSACPQPRPAPRLTRSPGPNPAAVRDETRTRRRGSGSRRPERKRRGCGCAGGRKQPPGWDAQALAGCAGTRSSTVPGSAGGWVSNVEWHQRCSESRQTEKGNELGKGDLLRVFRRYLCKTLKPSSTSTGGKRHHSRPPLLENSLSASGVN